MILSVKMYNRFTNHNEARNADWNRFNSNKSNSCTLFARLTMYKRNCGSSCCVKLTFAPKLWRQMRSEKRRLFVASRNTWSPETLPSRVPRFNYVTGGDATTTTTQPGPLLFVNWNIINIPLAVVLTTLDIEQTLDNVKYFTMVVGSIWQDVDIYFTLLLATLLGSVIYLNT